LTAPIGFCIESTVGVLQLSRNVGLKPLGQG
jgi:hypothetical protein